jgi:hypothetical protein
MNELQECAELRLIETERKAREIAEILDVPFSDALLIVRKIKSKKASEIC